MKRIALITGGVTGIGRAVVELFAAAGDTVAVCDLDAERGAKLAGDLASGAGLVRFLPCDVGSEDQVARAVHAVLDEHGRLDVLINNAGIIRRRAGEEINVADWDAVFRVNARGAFLMCREAVPVMKSQHSGRIINISSVAAKLGDITSAPGYGPAKAAMEALTKTFARELAPYNVTVNAVAPHAIETEMSAQWSEERRKAIIASIPLGRLGRPHEVAATAFFLASQGASFITGAVIDVNGGFVMA